MSNINKEENNNLMSLMGEIYGEGFDREKDAVTDYEEIPDGVYSAVVEKFEHKTSENTGNSWFCFWLQITSGNYQGKKYFANLWLTEKAAKTSLKKLSKYAFFMGIDIQPQDLADIKSLVNKMNDEEAGAVGVECTLTLKSSGSGDKKYTNWELSF